MSATLIRFDEGGPWCVLEDGHGLHTRCGLPSPIAPVATRTTTERLAGDAVCEWCAFELAADVALAGQPLPGSSHAE